MIKAFIKKFVPPSTIDNLGVGFSIRRLLTLNTASIIIAVVFGVIAGYLIPIFSDWSIYRLVFVFFVLILTPVLFLVIGNANRALLISLVFAIPLVFGLAPFG